MKQPNLGRSKIFVMDKLQKIMEWITPRKYTKNNSYSIAKINYLLIISYIKERSSQREIIE